MQTARCYTHPPRLTARLVVLVNSEGTQVLRAALSRFLALILAVGVTTSGFAQAGQWMDIGSARVNGQVGHDTLQARDKGTFRAIQIRARGSSVHFLLFAM